MGGQTLRWGGILSSYSIVVLPHLRYCLMIWGDFKGARSTTLGDSLLRYQKRLIGLIGGKGEGGGIIRIIRVWHV